ncbi:MAG: hypothetical protein RLZZ568_1853 [Cyanobacteriota bacterium]|jgi:tryptophan-rich sensory protein
MMTSARGNLAVAREDSKLKVKIFASLVTNLLGELEFMSDLNRGIMKFEGADKPFAIAITAIFVLGGISALIIWALRVAYVVS